MKLRYFLTSIIACLALAIGCTKEELPALSEITVTPSYFTFTVDGGAKEITVNALADWTVTDIPEWLTVAPAEGTATGAEGVKVTVTAQATQAEKIATATLKFNCAGKTQLVTVGQEAYVPDYPKFEAGEYWIMFGDEAVVPVSSAYGYLYTIKANKSQDGKLSSTADNIFTFTAVEGGFSIQDAAGKYYAMKGTYDSFNLYDTAQENYVYTVKQTGDAKFLITNTANGKFMHYDPAHSSAGAYSSEREGAIYPNLVSVAGAEIPEVLFAVEPTEVEVEKEGTDFNINMTCKTGEFEIEPSVDWITLKGMTSTNGEYVVTFACAENTEAARTGAIEFTSGEETITVTVNQAGAIAEVTIAEAIASDELCSVLGKVIFTHSKGVLITDGRDVLYGYLGAAPEVAVNDVVKMVGTVTKYNGGRSMNKPVVAKAEGTVGTYRTPAPVVLDAEKFAAYTSADADFATPYVMITGVAETDDDNNLIVKLVDGETTYSVKSYYGNDSFADWAGKEVKAYGYAYNAYANSKQVNLVAVTVLDADAEEPAGPEISTIASVLAWGQDAVIPDGTIVEGIVISNAVLSNLTSKKGMYLQDESGAVQLRFTNDHTFAFGDKLQLDLSGVKVGVYNQAVQLSVDNTKAVLVSTGNTVTPKTVTMADFLANKYEGQYVALEGVQVAEGDLAKTWIMPGSNNEAAHTSINMEDAEGNTFVVFSAKYATYGTEAVAQGSGTIKGISAKNNATIQIIFAQESDFAGLTGARFGQEGGEEPGEKAARNLAFSSAAATATLGEAFTAPTLSGETAGVVYTSSNTAVATVDAASGAVTLVAAGETTITAAAEETETLLAGSASYVLTVSAAAVEPVEPVLADGTYWIVANGNVATPLTSNYGYLKVTNGKNNPATNGFTFTYVSEQDAYTIQDNGGQYYYQSGTYDSYNRQATLPETGAYWKVEKADNNTYKITNLAVNKFVQYDPSYNSYGSYATQKGKLPELVSVVDNAIPYVVIDPSALSVEADKTSAQFTISADMPWTAEVTTGTATLSTTSGSADATVTVSFDANTSTTDSKQYTVTVKSAYGDQVITITQAKVSAAGEEVTETISGTFTYDTTAKTLSLTTASGITITQKIASGSTAIGQSYNTATTLRVYKGHALTFSGKTITKIKLTHASDRAGDSVTASVGEYTAGSTSSEWIGEATQVVITNTGAGSNVQLRPTKIEVTYKK